MSNFLKPYIAFRLLCPWVSPGKNTGSGFPCPPSGDHPDPRVEPKSLMSPVLSGRFFTTSTTWEALYSIDAYDCINWQVPEKCPR